MTLEQRIDSDLKEAMRAKDAAKLSVLRMLKSALKYSAIEKAGADGKLDDTEATQVIRKQVKQRQDSIESFEKGGRAELRRKRESGAGDSWRLSAEGHGARRAGKDRARNNC
jgi:uncharacterized protein